MKKLNQLNIILSESIEKVTVELETKERNIRQLKLNEDTLNHQFKNELERLDLKHKNESQIRINETEKLEKELESTKEKVKNLSNENKNLNEKTKLLSDYNSLKKEVLYLRDKIVNLENENSNFGLLNINLQKQIEKLIENLANESRKYETTKLEVKI